MDSLCQAQEVGAWHTWAEYGAGAAYPDKDAGVGGAPNYLKGVAAGAEAEGPAGSPRGNLGTVTRGLAFLTWRYTQPWQVQFTFPRVPGLQRGPAWGYICAADPLGTPEPPKTRPRPLLAGRCPFPDAGGAGDFSWLPGRVWNPGPAGPSPEPGRGDGRGLPEAGARGPLICAGRADPAQC